MNKREYAEFYKYLGILKYEYLEQLFNCDLNSNNANEIKEILKAINILLDSMLINGGK